MGNGLTKTPTAVKVVPILRDMQRQFRAIDDVMSQPQNSDSSQNEDIDKTEKPNDVKKNDLDDTSMSVVCKTMDELKTNIKKFEDVLGITKSAPKVADPQDAKPQMLSSSSINAFPVQVYCQREDICPDIMKKIISKCKDKGTNIYFVPQLSETKNTPGLVICLNSSRLGVDIEKSLTDIPVSRRIALVIIHTQQPHALPTVSSEISFSEYSSQLGGIFDLAYLPEEGGVYDCKLNTDNLKKIYKFIIKKNSSFQFTP